MIARLKRWFEGAGATAAPVDSARAPEPPTLATMRHYGALARAAGVDRLYLLLTFDCDTDGDIAIVTQLESDLRKRDIHAGFAVPGAQLEKGASTWRQLGDRGCEFLNHGGRPHTEWRGDRFWPITFYDQLADEAIVSDIQDGHRRVIEITGTTPEGFRAPHFGSFQQPAQLQLLYETLKPLGYRYASTTLPSLGLTHGPFVDMDGIIELPTMGSFRNPTTLLDSWTYLTDRANFALGDEYYELFAETLARMTEYGIPGILTYYADPSHVMGQRPFERALDAVARFNVPSLTGHDAVRRFGRGV